MAAGCRRSAVSLWPQPWSPTAPIWESWTWVTTTCRIQEWSCCVILIFCRVHTVDWRLWGQFTDSLLLWSDIYNWSWKRYINKMYYYYWKYWTKMICSHITLLFLKGPFDVNQPRILKFSPLCLVRGCPVYRCDHLPKLWTLIYLMLLKVYYYYYYYFFYSFFMVIVG